MPCRTRHFRRNDNSTLYGDSIIFRQHQYPQYRPGIVHKVVRRPIRPIRPILVPLAINPITKQVLRWIAVLLIITMSFMFLGTPLLF